MKVALISPGTAGKTAITDCVTAFAKAMRGSIRIDYVSEAAGEYKGLALKSIAEFDPSDYDVLHFHWGNNPLHQFAFSTLLKVSDRKRRPLIVSTLHEAELGYMLGASDQARRYQWYFKLRNGIPGSLWRRPDYGFFSHYTVAEVLRRSDYTIVHSEYAKDRLIKEHQLGADAARIHVARLGIDWNDYAQTVPIRHPQIAGAVRPMVILYVGSLHPIKSIDKMIRALHLVKHFGNEEDFYFVVVGSGPERYRLDDLAQALIPGQYTFAGEVPDVLPYYGLSDLAVCPRAFSRGEVSYSIPEACAAGKPVMLPELGGWTEYIDRSRGFPVAADDEVDYAEVLLHCLRNPGELEEKGIESRRFAEECLSWQKQTEFFLSLYVRRPKE